MLKIELLLLESNQNIVCGEERNYYRNFWF